MLFAIFPSTCSKLGAHYKTLLGHLQRKFLAVCLHFGQFFTGTFVQSWNLVQEIQDLNGSRLVFSGLSNSGGWTVSIGNFPGANGYAGCINDVPRKSASSCSRSWNIANINTFMLASFCISNVC